STNGNIILNSANNNGYINLVSTGINPTNNSTGYTLLGISRINNVVTSDSANIFKIGNDANGKNYLSVDNNTTSNGILIQGNKISLNASTNPINIVGGGITNPIGTNNSILMLNSSGNIITGNTTTSAFNCGTLTSGDLTCNNLNAAIS
ncbi:MAG: hypothetical protein ACOVOV_03685, partial [Dolichospermum sp.]